MQQHFRIVMSTVTGQGPGLVLEETTRTNRGDAMDVARDWSASHAAAIGAGRIRVKVVTA